MGYLDGSNMELWKWAKEYTLADHFFMGAYGGSFLNHLWLVCACTPQFPDAPASITAQVEPDGKLKRRPDSPASVMNGPMRVFDGQVTPDGYAVNTSQPPYQPSGTAPATSGMPISPTRCAIRCHRRVRRRSVTRSQPRT